MASVQTGKAVVFGFPGTATPTVSIGTFIKDSGDISNDIKVDEIRNEDNELVGMIHSGETFELTLMMTPIGTGLANARLSLSPPAKGTIVVLSDFHDDGSAAFINGNWTYVGGFKVAFKKDGIATYEMKLKKSAFADITAVMT